MKEYSNIEIFNYFKRCARTAVIFIITAFLWAVIFPHGADAADTGSILIHGDIAKLYSFSTMTGGTPNYTEIWFENLSYSGISDFKLNGSTTGSYMTFGLDYESTIFSCLYGCIGGGVVYYYDPHNLNQDRYIRWIFNSGTTFNRDRMYLSYTKNIFANVTWVGYLGMGVATSIDHPVGVDNEGGTAGFIQGIYDVNLYSETTDTYSVYYFGAGYFNLTVIKNGAVNDRWFWNSSSGYYGYETTGDKTGFTAVALYSEGLYGHVVLDSGKYIDFTINSTGAPDNPNQPPDINPETGVGIKFDYDNYPIGGTANISWKRVIAVPFLDTDYIVLIYPDSTEEELITSPPDNGYIKKTLSKTGQHKVEFRRSSILSGVSVLDSDTAKVNSYAASWIVANATYYIGVPGNITYFQDANNSASIVEYYWSDGDGKYHLGKQNWGTVSGVITNYSFSCAHATKYKITLSRAGVNWSDPPIEDAATYTSCKVDNSNPQYNITKSFMNLSTNTPQMTDYLDIEYGVDSVSWKNNQTFIKVFDANNIEIFSYAVTEQYKKIPFFIVPSPHTIFDMVMKPGTNTLKLVTQAGIVLDTDIVTVAEKTGEGYGLSFDKQIWCSNDKIVFTYFAPDTSNITLYNDVGNLVYAKTINASFTGKKDYILYRKTGTYEVRLLNQYALQKYNTAIKIESCEPTPTNTPATGLQLGNTIMNFFGMPAFWGLIIWILIVYGVASNGRAGQDMSKATELVAVIVAAIEAIIGLWNPFTWWIVAILIIALGARFYTGRKVITEG